MPPPDEEDGDPGPFGNGPDGGQGGPGNGAPARDDADFEAKHNRANNGQFGEGGGSSGASGQLQTSVHITGKELGGDLPTKELRRAATEYAKKHFAGKEYHNVNSDADIGVTNQGIKHGLANANEIEIRLIPALPWMLERAKYAGSEPDKSGRADIKAAHKYITKVRVGEETLTVGIVVRELADGHRYYDHFAIKNTPAGTSGAASHDGKLGVQPSAGAGKLYKASSQDAASLAAGILYLANSRVLLLKRGTDTVHHPGTWAFPAGHVEAGETPLQAALRESKEEVGHAPESAERLREGGGFTLFLSRGQPFTPALNEESDGYVWARPDDLPQPLHPGVREAVEQALA